MSQRTTTWLAWATWIVSVLLVTSAGLLVLLSFSARTPRDSGMLLLMLLLLLTFPTVGVLVASRHPENPIGWILCGVGVAGGVVSLAAAYAEYATNESTRSLPGVPYATWLWSWAAFPIALLAATMLFLLFPNGRLPSPPVIWRPVAWTAVIAGAVNAFGVAFGPDTADTSYTNPFATSGFLGDQVEMLANFGFGLLALSGIASLGAPFLRLRRARGQERQQLKWFAYATALTGSSVVVLLSLPDETHGPGSLGWKVSSLAWTLMIIGFLLIPLSIGVAILRYRLYDIDRIINRTLVYGSLTAILAGAYLGGVVAAQAVLGGLTRQGDLPQLVIVASTLAIAGLFNPLRRRLQIFVDRRFYRRKYDVRKTLETFSVKLRDETDLNRLAGEMVGVVRETMQPEHVSVWLRPYAEPRAREGTGRPR
jgi:hypothetical protein